MNFWKFKFNFFPKKEWINDYFIWLTLFYLSIYLVEKGHRVARDGGRRDDGRAADNPRSYRSRKLEEENRVNETWHKSKASSNTHPCWQFSTNSDN